MLSYLDATRAKSVVKVRVSCILNGDGDYQRQALRVDGAEVGEDGCNVDSL